MAVVKPAKPAPTMTTQSPEDATGPSCWLLLSFPFMKAAMITFDLVKWGVAKLDDVRGVVLMNSQHISSPELEDDKFCSPSASLE